MFYAHEKDAIKTKDVIFGCTGLKIVHFKLNQISFAQEINTLLSVKIY
jgi:hypothetical protein